MVDVQIGRQYVLDRYQYECSNVPSMKGSSITRCPVKKRRPECRRDHVFWGRWDFVATSSNLMYIHKAPCTLSRSPRRCRRNHLGIREALVRCDRLGGAGGLVNEVWVGDLLKDGGMWWCGLNVECGAWEVCVRVGWCFCLWSCSGGDRIRVDKPKIRRVVVFVVDAPPFVFAPVCDECLLNCFLFIVDPSTVHDSMAANHISCDDVGSTILGWLTAIDYNLEEAIQCRIQCRRAEKTSRCKIHSQDVLAARENASQQQKANDPTLGCCVCVFVIARDHRLGL